MVKVCGKKKKIYLSLTDDILVKELEVCLHEPLQDVADIKIENDSEFKLLIKENTVKSTTSNIFFKSAHANKCDVKKNRELKETFVTEIIDVKCTQKQPDEQNVFIKLHNINNITKQDECEVENKSQNDFKHTNDIKSDLQSLLIMMAISSSCYDGDEKTVNIKDETHPIFKVNTEKYNANLEFFEEINNGNKMSDLLKIEAFKFPKQEVSTLLRKYANKWKEFMKGQRERKLNHERLTTINNFFDKLEKRKRSNTICSGPSNKAKLQVHDYNTYQHRYRVQKHIIALQKEKLEQQHKLIEELKYNNIVEASRQSLDLMKENVKQTYYEIDKHLKPKIKCLTNELKIREIEEDSLVLHCLKVPQFLQRMEARAREREEKHAIIRERRKQMEEERIRLKQQAELAKAEMDKEEKIKRIKELRDKRKREKVDSIRKKQYAERLRALIVMADLHYEKTIMAKYGIKPLKQLIDMKRDNMEKAKGHFAFQLKKNVFLHWMWYTEDMWYERNYKAEDFCRKKMLRKAFSYFKQNHKEYLLKMQVANDYYDLYVTQIMFKKLQDGILIMKKELNIKWNNAIVYYSSNLLFKTLTSWRTLPALNALKREQDARKLRWREKVLQVVPDYTPPED